jgi:imidazolonepropionase-like amidohydrolase
MVKEAVDAGMDFIKIVVSDMHISFWPKKSKPLEPEIIEAIIDEAHSHGIPVACHVDNLDHANLVVDYGADEVHHLANMASPRYELTEYGKLFIKMCEKNVWLVPTISAQRAFEPARIERGCFDGSTDYINNVLHRAYESGVLFGAGCDSGCPGVPWGKCLYGELAEYVYNVGMTPLEAIKCACANNARLSGMENKLGVVKAGAYADLLVLDKDPTEDIGNLASVYLVFRDGEIVTDNRMG